MVYSTYIKAYGFATETLIVLLIIIMSEPIKGQSLQEIADKGAALYGTVKDKYELNSKGKFLAIEVEKGGFYIGDTSKEALEEARASNPGKLFYLVKIGFNSTETLAHSLVGRP